MVRLKKLNILFLEDNEEFAKNTTSVLNIYFKKVFHSNNIIDAMTLFDTYKIDVIISDIKVKGGNGLNFIKEVREKNEDVPIVILSAHKDENFLFKAIGLNLLSYELKPLRYEQLLSVLEKISKKLNSEKLIQIAPQLSYSYKTKLLYENDKEIKLAKREFLLIELLIKNKNTSVSIELIQKDVWQEKPMSEAAIKNLILRLRKKVSTKFIVTVTNMGYKLSHSY
ncbi:response regulator transcription factor [Sulfurimonas sp.]|uniref:response regulator transcription factor n=1 Tax=Sulfurimonas sp. TaxID=2022749 RepID=UPI002AB2AC6C|nr:response regulator transcription factor [Sulfurimonas sp.]